MGFPTSPSEGEEHTTLLGTVYKYTNIPAGEDKWYIINADINLNDLTEKNHVSLAAKNGEADVQHLTAAQVAALHAIYAVNTIPLQAGRLANGSTWNTYTSTQVIVMPAADNNCDANFSGIMPSNATAMTNPTLHIRFAGAAADSWVINVTVHASAASEAQGSNLHNGAETLTAGAGATFYDKAVALTGTISPSDLIGIRMQKTSSDAQILYITGSCYIER